MKLKDFLTLKVGAGVLISGTRYNPYINYSWSTKTVGTSRKLTDLGTAKLDANMFTGRAMYFDSALAQTSILNINATIQTIYYFNGTNHVYAEGSQTLTTYTLNGSKQYSNLIFYNGIFTASQKLALENTPEEFLYYDEARNKYSNVLNASELSKVVAHFPMTDTDGFIRDNAKNPVVAYPITNYISSMNKTELNTGLQTGKLKLDSNGLIIGKSDYLEFYGKGYIDTGIILPLDTSAETIEIIITKAKTLQEGYNKVISFTGVSITSVIEIAKDTRDKITIRHRGLAASSLIITDSQIMFHIVTAGDTVYLYADGMLKSSSTKAVYTSTTRAIINGIRQGVNIINGVNNVNIRLFKVHAKALTQEEVTKNYNDAVSKGLLSDITTVPSNALKVNNEPIKINNQFITIGV